MNQILIWKSKNLKNNRSRQPRQQLFSKGMANSDDVVGIAETVVSVSLKFQVQKLIINLPSAASRSGSGSPIFGLRTSVSLVPNPVQKLVCPQNDIVANNGRSSFDGSIQLIFGYQLKSQAWFNHVSFSFQAKQINIS